MFYPSTIKEDRDGDVVVAGSFQKTVDFGGGQMDSPGEVASLPIS